MTDKIVKARVHRIMSLSELADLCLHYTNLGLHRYHPILNGLLA
ncbi:hypothetical protein [Vibrio vulnificus]|nr:hypothetical protein [Vibrio vulnificus]